MVIAVLCTGWASDAGAQAPASDGAKLSRVDVFGGYAYFDPFSSDIANIKYPPVPLGGVVSAAWYLRGALGAEVEAYFAPKGPEDNNCVTSAEVGPIARLQRGSLSGFVHVLAGTAKVGGPALQPCNVSGWGWTAGFGFDAILPAFSGRLAVRPVQLDLMYAHIDNGPLQDGGESGGLGKVEAVRVSTGVVLRLGEARASAKAAPLQCAANPHSVLAGEPVTLTTSNGASAGKKVVYRWSTNGGRIARDGTSGEIDTAGLRPGWYDASVTLSVGSRKLVVASCTARFTIAVAPGPNESPR